MVNKSRILIFFMTCASKLMAQVVINGSGIVNLNEGVVAIPIYLVLASSSLYIEPQLELLMVL